MSDATPAGPGLKTYFDPEHVERAAPDRPWRLLALIATAATAAATLGWELHWRGKGHIAGDFKNTAGLWAQARRSVGPESTVLIGASRIFFGVDLDVWEEESQRGRPIQLALEGTSFRPILSDLAKDETFRGLVIAGYVPAIVYTNFTYRQDVIDYAREESPSQRVDHLLSMQLEKAFAFIDDQTRPKKMIYNAKLPVRPGMQQRFDVDKLEILEADRNAEVWRRVMDDEAYREMAKYVWDYGMDAYKPPPFADGDVDKAIAEISADVDAIRARGGDVAFVQMPYDGGYEKEESLFPRERFWHPLLTGTRSVGVSFFDHPELQNYYLPEWSHLAPREAERYTRALVPIFYRALDRTDAAAGQR